MEHYEIYRACDDVIAELLKFDDSLLELGGRIEDDRLECFEKSIGFQLPVDLTYILHRHNGLSLMGTEILGLDKDCRAQSLNEVYRYEHEDAGNPIPAHFLPFSPDGLGNHYCLNLQRLNDGVCPVIFWQHDYEYPSLNDVETCNHNLIEWIKETMIQWTLDDYNYDGTEK